MSIKKVTIVGSGNVGSQLAAVLSAKGYIMHQVFSRSFENAGRMASKYDAKFTDSLAEIDNKADLYMIAVKDDAISEVASKLRLHGKIVVHTSGTKKLDALSKVTDRSGVFYPLQTFTKNRKPNWKKIPICIEGKTPEVEDNLKALAESISEKVVILPSKDRTLVHASAVFTNNFVNRLLLHSKELLDKKNIDFNLLMPLAEETVKKAFELGPEHSQTGPAMRGDVKTIKKHLELLKDSPETQELYRYFSELIMRDGK